MSDVGAAGVSTAGPATSLSHASPVATTLPLPDHAFLTKLSNGELDRDLFAPQRSPSSKHSAPAPPHSAGADSAAQPPDASMPFEDSFTALLSFGPAALADALRKAELRLEQRGDITEAAMTDAAGDPAQPQKATAAPPDEEPNPYEVWTRRVARLLDVSNEDRDEGSGSTIASHLDLHAYSAQDAADLALTTVTPDDPAGQILRLKCLLAQEEARSTFLEDRSRNLEADMLSCRSELARLKAENRALALERVAARARATEQHLQPQQCDAGCKQIQELNAALNATLDSTISHVKELEKQMAQLRARSAGRATQSQLSDGAPLDTEHSEPPLSVDEAHRVHSALALAAETLQHQRTAALLQEAKLLYSGCRAQLERCQTEVEQLRRSLQQETVARTDAVAALETSRMEGARLQEAVAAMARKLAHLGVDSISVNVASAAAGEGEGSAAAAPMSSKHASAAAAGSSASPSNSHAAKSPVSFEPPSSQPQHARGQSWITGLGWLVGRKHADKKHDAAPAQHPATKS